MKWCCLETFALLQCVQKKLFQTSVFKIKFKNNPTAHTHMDFGFMLSDEAYEMSEEI